MDKQHTQDIPVEHTLLQSEQTAPAAFLEGETTADFFSSARRLMGYAAPVAGVVIGVGVAVVAPHVGIHVGGVSTHSAMQIALSCGSGGCVR